MLTVGIPRCIDGDLWCNNFIEHLKISPAIDAKTDEPDQSGQKNSIQNVNVDFRKCPSITFFIEFHEESWPGNYSIWDLEWQISPEVELVISQKSIDDIFDDQKIENKNTECDERSSQQKANQESKW